MVLDGQLSFVPLGSTLSLVAGAGVSIPSTNVIDIIGAGVGVAPPNIIGTAALFGADIGVGGHLRPEIMCAIGTACATSNSATLNAALQAAPDTGAAGGYVPTTWTTIAETGAIAAASLTAGQIIARFPFLPAFPANLRPRFLRLYFQIPAATNFTAGTIGAAVVTLVRDDLAQKNATRNYTVA
jgi:hypothetical protein